MVNKNEPRSPFEERAKELFDDSVERVDGRTRSALTQARHAALAELKTKRWTPLRIWAPVTGVAVAAIVAVIMLNPTTREPGAVESVAGVTFDDLDIVADADNLEMLENLDFYSWLDSTDALPSG